LAREYCELAVPCFDNVARCLDETQPEALAVYTPDVHHEQAVIAALKRGVNVYCEKPMSTTLAACDRMIAAAKASKAVFYMGHNMRMSPFYETIHEVLAGGEVGELLTLETSEYYYGGRTYFRRWNRLLSVSGGLWITKSVHDFDMMCWLAGDEPATVYATGGRKVFQPKPGAAERCRDCGLRWECDDYTPLTSLTVGDGRSLKQARFWDQWQQLGAGAGYLPADACLYRSDIETLEYGVAAVRFAGGACAAHTMSVVSSPPVSARWLTAQGTKGTVTGDPTANTIRVNFRGDKATRTYDVNEQSRGGHGGADGRAFADFVRACRLGTAPVATWADGRRAVKLGLGAQKSMETGAVVALAGD
jgi:predicted dehydrogenase